MFHIGTLVGVVVKTTGCAAYVVGLGTSGAGKLVKGAGHVVTAAGKILVAVGTAGVAVGDVVDVTGGSLREAACAVYESADGWLVVEDDKSD